MQQALAAIKTTNPARPSIYTSDCAATHNSPTHLYAGGVARQGSKRAAQLGLDLGQFCCSQSSETRQLLTCDTLYLSINKNYLISLQNIKINI